jgi:hypothetical protein
LKNAKTFRSTQYYPPTLCDGTRLEVEHLNKNISEATILTEYAKREIEFIPKIPIIQTI